MVVLGVAVAFLWKERHDNRIPPWILDLQQDDWVTRAELDQYHLRVIQMSQAQRELINTRFNELSKPSGHPLHTMDTPLDSTAAVEVAVPPPPEPEPVPATLTASITEDVLPEASSPVEDNPPPSPAMDSEPLGQDAPSRAISLFREGKTIDQIAQELRIGKQEAQLLIRMAQHRPSSLAGV